MKTMPFRLSVARLKYLGVILNWKPPKVERERFVLYISCPFVSIRG